MEDLTPDGTPSPWTTLTATSYRSFVDPQNTNRVGFNAEVLDMERPQRSLGSAGAAGATKHDGVRPDTILVLVGP